MKVLHMNSVFKTKETKTWQNVHSAEKKFNLRKPGRWLADQTKQEREQNLQSAYASAAAKPSEQQSASRKSNLLKDQTLPLLLFASNQFLNVSERGDVSMQGAWKSPK